MSLQLCCKKVNFRNFLSNTNETVSCPALADEDSTECRHYRAFRPAQPSTRSECDAALLLCSPRRKASFDELFEFYWPMYSAGRFHTHVRLRGGVLSFASTEKLRNSSGTAVASGCCVRRSCNKLQTKPASSGGSPRVGRRELLAADLGSS